MSQHILKGTTENTAKLRKCNIKKGALKYGFNKNVP